MTVGRSDMSKFTQESWQGSITVNSERGVQTLEPSSEQKNALRKFLQGENLLVNLPTRADFPELRVWSSLGTMHGPRTARAKHETRL